MPDLVKSVKILRYEVLKDSIKIITRTNIGMRVFFCTWLGIHRKSKLIQRF